MLRYCDDEGQSWFDIQLCNVQMKDLDYPQGSLMNSASSAGCANYKKPYPEQSFCTPDDMLSDTWQKKIQRYINRLLHFAVLSAVHKHHVSLVANWTLDWLNSFSNSTQQARWQVVKLEWSLGIVPQLVNSLGITTKCPRRQRNCISGPWKPLKEIVCRGSKKCYVLYQIPWILLCQTCRAVAGYSVQDGA